PRLRGALLRLAHAVGGHRDGEGRFPRLLVGLGDLNRHAGGNLTPGGSGSGERGVGRRSPESGSKACSCSGSNPSSTCKPTSARTPGATRAVSSCPPALA